MEKSGRCHQSETTTSDDSTRTLVDESHDGSHQCQRPAMAPDRSSAPWTDIGIAHAVTMTMPTGRAKEHELARSVTATLGDGPGSIPGSYQTCPTTDGKRATRHGGSAKVLDALIRRGWNPPVSGAAPMRVKASTSGHHESFLGHVRPAKRPPPERDGRQEREHPHALIETGWRATIARISAIAIPPSVAGESQHSCRRADAKRDARMTRRPRATKVW